MKFPSVYSEKKKFYSEPGCGMQPEYQLQISKDGKEELVKIGETNLHEYIQSWRDSVDLDLIMERYRNGNEDVINRMKGFYADVANLPSNMLDLMNMNLKGKQAFENLPVEVKELYGNSYFEFLADPGRMEKLITQDVANESVDKDSDRNSASEGSKEGEN